MKHIVAMLGLSLAASLACAADCRLAMQASTPTERFQLGGDTVSDSKTTLVWMRCALGQQWNGSICLGEPQAMDWRDAKTAVERLNREGYAGHNDWRLPALPELASIVERQCFHPRMNEAVFPGAPSRVFWSSMEKSGTAEHAYTLDFADGAAEPMLKGYLNAVRLVRGGPWWQPPKVAAK